LLGNGAFNAQITLSMLSEAKHLWSNPLGDYRIDPEFFDVAQNDTEIWLLV